MSSRLKEFYQNEVVPALTKKFGYTNVMLVVDGKPTRVGFEIKDGKKVRVAKKTGKAID